MSGNVGRRPPVAASRQGKQASRPTSIATHPSVAPTRSTLVDVVAQDTQLFERKGEYWGLCPFHTERTPSFSVNAETQVYYCFGCGAKGDVVTYLVEKRGMPLIEAIRLVRDRSSAPPMTAARRASYDRLALSFYMWLHDTRRLVTMLHDEIWLFEKAYDQTVRRPDLYPPEEMAYIETYLGDLYLKLQMTLDTVGGTNDEIFARWREETNDGKAHIH